MRIGIDPGVTGAVAVLRGAIHGDGRNFIIFDMPVMTTGKKQQINPYEFYKLLTMAVDRLDDCTVYLEQVSAMPGQGVTSSFGFGVSFGIIQGVLAALGVPVVMVAPSTWKRRAKLIGKDKDQARTLAQRLYPSVELGRKKDVGRADAILIARFGSE